MSTEKSITTWDESEKNPRSDEKGAYWSGVFAMTLCVFVLIASEFMPVSLLTPIAHALSVTNGMAGQGIAISGIFAVFTSLFIASFTQNVNRKTLMLVLTAMMGVSGAIIGLADSYLMYMVGRALIGAVVGGFWSMSAAIAMRLVPQHDVPKALAVFNSGNALAVVMAAPLGAYVGSVIGWRGAFLGLIPISMITILWQWVSLPSMPSHSENKESGSVFAAFILLKRKEVAIGIGAVGLFFLGQFSLYTYVRPFLEMIVHVDVALLSIILAAIGIAGFIGTLLITTPLKQAFFLTLIVIPVVMACVAAGLIVFSGSLMVVVTLLVVWGLIATSAPVGWWSWVAKVFPDDAEAGGGLMVAVIQFSIALGATLGGIVFDTLGYEATFIISALTLLLAAALTSWAARTTR